MQDRARTLAGHAGRVLQVVACVAAFAVYGGCNQSSGSPKTGSTGAASAVAPPHETAPAVADQMPALHLPSTGTPSATPARAPAATPGLSVLVPTISTPTNALSPMPTATPQPAPAPPSPPPAPAPPSSPPAPAPPFDSLTLTPTDPTLAYALQLVNAVRTQNGAPAIPLDVTTSTCSLRHSQDLYGCAGGSLSNVGTSFSGTNGGPTGCAHQDYIHGDRCGALAENQGVSPLPDDEAGFKQAHDEMVAEKGEPGPNHFTNLIDSRWTSVSIGLYRDPDQGWLWITEDFR